MKDQMFLPRSKKGTGSNKSVELPTQRTGAQFSSQRTHTLGVVTAELRHIGPSRTLSGITSAAEEAGYSVLLKELPSYDTEDITPIFQAFLSRHVDGIIWAVPEVGENRKWVNNPPADIDAPSCVSNHGDSK